MNEAPVSPQNRYAEQTVLGSMLRDNNVISDVLTILRREDFYLAHHQYIFQAMADLIAEGKPADLVTVANVLHERQLIQEVRYPYLAEIWDASPTAAHATHYANLVRDRSIARSLRQAASKIQQSIADGTPAMDLLDLAEKEVFAVSQLGVKGHTYHVDSILRESFDRIDARLSGQMASRAVMTGLEELDDLLCGLQNSELSILAARPSVGKTSLGLQLAMNVALQGTPVFFVSLEMACVELAERMLCNLSGVNSHKLRRGWASKDDLHLLMEAKYRLNGKPLHFDDAGSQTITRIASNARRLKMRHGIRLVVVDYLTLIQPEDRKAPRQEQVAQIARRLKMLAKDLEIPVLALAQLNRRPEDSDRPRLHHLRESGEIEQSADTVMLIHRPDEANRSLIKLYVDKQRNGKTGDVGLYFRQECMRFETLAHTNEFAA